ncbi:putative acetyltransferase [compost metagenome]
MMTRRAVLIRDAERSDVEAIKKVLLDAYSQYEFLLEKERWDQYKADIVRSVTDTRVKARIVAELDGEIIGSVFLYPSSDAAYGLPELNINTPIMRLLAVAREVRGLGIATELIRASVRKSLRWGADTLHLHTNELMYAAIRLYEQLGFERANDKDIIKGDSVVKSYRLHLKETTILGGRKHG